MGFLNNIFSGAKQFGQRTKAASDINATLQELFKPVWPQTQMKSTDFVNDTYVVGFMLGASDIVVRTLGFKGDEAAEISKIAVGLIFKPPGNGSLPEDPQFGVGYENGLKVAHCLYSPLTADKSDAEYIKAKSELAAAGLPESKVGSYLVSKLLHEYILRRYARS